MGHGAEREQAGSAWPPQAMTMTKPRRWWEAFGFLSRVGWESLNGLSRKAVWPELDFKRIFLPSW